jgi:hypothetical protein
MRLGNQKLLLCTFSIVITCRKLFTTAYFYYSRSLSLPNFNMLKNVENKLSWKLGE